MAEQTRRLPHNLHSTFISLRNPNFRVYFVAQIGSNIGSWIQITAENWLVLQLTDSGLALGITNALQFGPLVFFGLYGGVVADRFDRRRLLIVTQSALALLAAATGLLVATNLIQMWMIWVTALLLGLMMCIDKPALLSFVKDLVGEAYLPNAVALNNAAISSGRMIGPAISGVMIASFGMAPSFLINAVSFGLVVLVLMILDACDETWGTKTGAGARGLVLHSARPCSDANRDSYVCDLYCGLQLPGHGAARGVACVQRVERIVWYCNVVIGSGCPCSVPY
jgi:MFS family permease